MSLLCFFAVTIYLCDSNFRRDAKHLDFRVFYAAGQMVADGAGSRLYDMEAQRDYQRRAIPDLRHEVYPFPYPAATALLYVPLTRLSLRTAYDVWCVLSVALLALSLELLRRSVLPAAKLAWSLPLSLLYIPVGATLVNGQTSLVVLAIFAGAFALSLAKRNLAAGLLVALALVKLNFVAPFIVVIALMRKFRLLAGFLAGAILFGAVCVMVAGLSFPATYWHFLAFYKVPAGTITAWPAGMPNLRGLFFLLFHHDPKVWLLAILLGSVLWLATRADKSPEAAFPSALLAAVLLSYHANLHDLTLLILPSFVVAATTGRRSLAFGIALLILLPPLLAVLMVTHTLALAAIPILLLLLFFPASNLAFRERGNIPVP